jgi:hypothetical protein
MHFARIDFHNCMKPGHLRISFCNSPVSEKLGENSAHVLSLYCVQTFHAAPGPHARLGKGGMERALRPREREETMTAVQPIQTRASSRS